MKKAILLICAAVIGFTAMAQSNSKPVAAPKADTTKTKPVVKDKYEYFGKVSVSDIKGISVTLEDYRRTVMYDPSKTDEQKVAVFRNIDGYLQSMQDRVKIDSVKIPPPDTAKAKAKTK